MRGWWGWMDEVDGEEYEEVGRPRHRDGEKEVCTHAEREEGEAERKVRQRGRQVLVDTSGSRTQTCGEAEKVG